MKKVNVLSAAKIMAVVYLLLGIVIAVVILLVGGLFTEVFGTSSLSAFGRGAIIAITVPVALCVFGFVAIAIEAWLYNIIAGKIGGIKLELRSSQLRSVDPVSAGKMAAIGGAILGVLVGIAVLVVGVASRSVLFALFGLAGIFVLGIVFAIGGFLIAAIEAVIYNYLASKMGPVTLYFRGTELKRIGIIQFAKIEAVFGAIGGFFEGVVYSVRSVFPMASSNAPVLAHALGLWSIIIFPILYAILTFVFAAVEIFLYNWLVPKAGGAKVTISG